MGASEGGSKVWDGSMGLLKVAPNKIVHPRSLRTRETHFILKRPLSIKHSCILKVLEFGFLLMYCVRTLLADKMLKFKGLIRKRIFLSGQTWCDLVPAVGKAAATVEGLCL